MDLSDRFDNLVTILQRIFAAILAAILVAIVILAAVAYDPTQARSLVIGLVLLPIALGSMAWGLHRARRRRGEV
jgi:hypothetical protein